MSTIKERTEIAKTNRRDIPEILKEIKELAMLSDDIALSCFYVIFDKESQKYFTGISVRFAELIASCWGNIHAGAKILSNTGLYVTVQGFVHDFEKNTIVTVEVQRSLARLNSEQSIHVTNAASSIAFRNAIFKAIPAVVTSSITKEIKNYILNNIGGGNIIKELISYFKSKNITVDNIEKLIGGSIIDVDSEKLFLLVGLRNAIEEGGVTVFEVFGMEHPTKNNKKTSRFNFDDVSDSETEQEINIPIINKEGNSLKNALSSLGDVKKNIIEEEVMGDVIYTEEKKRGRGRPRKD